MGYTLRNGRFSGTRPVDLGAAQGKTVSVDGLSAVVETGEGVLSLRLRATAVGASATLDLTIETSDDGASNWTSVGTFVQVTTSAGTQNQYKAFPVGRFVRANYNYGGTGTLDISLLGEHK